MQTKTYNVYTFDELSDEQKEKARDWFRDGNEYHFLGEAMDEHLQDLLLENKLKCDEPKIMYSLSYSQGDGAMFEGTVYFKSYYATIKHAGHYCHYNSKDIEINSVKTDKEASDKVYKEFNDVYVDICRKLEKYGYDYIEYEDSDEVVDDIINANEYEFTSDGKID